MESVPVVPGCVVWIQTDCQTMLPVRDGPIKIVTDGGKTKRAVGFSRTLIQLNCFGRRLFGRERGLDKRPDTENAEPVVVISDTGVGQRVLWIQLNRVVVAFEGLG